MPADRDSVSADRKYDPRPLLELVGQGQRGPELVPAIRDRFDCSKTQAHDWLQSFVAAGLLSETQLPRRGGPKLYEITEKGKRVARRPRTV